MLLQHLACVFDRFLEAVRTIIWVKTGQSFSEEKEKPLFCFSKNLRFALKESKILIYVMIWLLPVSYKKQVFKWPFAEYINILLYRHATV